MKQQQLRLITLERQGLINAESFGTGKDAVLLALEQLGYLQIDTLSVVERAHHHTLWTRIPDYKTEYLDNLVKEQKVFEHWFHAASYLPMNDFRFALPKMLEIKQNGSQYYNADKKIMNFVMDTIRNEGPKRAIDFESEAKKTGSWWNWKPAKLALERLFIQGDLMICERNGMQKKYDLTERVLPASIDTSAPSPLEFAEYLVKTYLRAYGFTTVKQITHLKTGTVLRKNVEEVLHSVLKENTVQRLESKEFPTVFIQSNLLDKPIQDNDLSVRLLSPFDNSIIHRDRVTQFFGFDYRLECYLPKEKRKYGYFCLPVLFGDVFIGRADCKAHRKEKLFEIIHLHIEKEGGNIELWETSFIKALKNFAAFNGCSSIVLKQVTPSKLTAHLSQLLQNNS